MKQFLKNSSLVILILLLTAGTVSANLASSGNRVDVNCTIDRYAEINTADIRADAWIDYDAPEWESLWLRLWRSKDKSSTNGEGSSFTGKGGEVKWARQEIVVNSNTPFKIRAKASYPVHSDNQSTLNSKYGKPSTFYSYLFPVSLCGKQKLQVPGKIIPGQKSAFLPGKYGTTKYVLASKVAMPEEFWQVKAGQYVGNVTLTVLAR
jgi:hypothetical protein